MFLTLDGIVTDVRPLAELNANPAIDSTPSGITAFPLHPRPETTMLSSIVKVPDPVTDPSVTQLTTSSAKAFAGLKTKPESTNAVVVRSVANLRISNVTFSMSQ